MTSFTGNPGSLLPTDFLIPTDKEDLEVKLRTYFNQIAYSVNEKETGIYDEEITVTGGQFIPTYSTQTQASATSRPILRKTFSTGALPNATSSTTAHNLTLDTNFSVVRLYGAATNPTNSWIPIPFASPTLNQNISLELNSTNIIITTGIDRTAYTRSFVVVEYITTV